MRMHFYKYFTAVSLVAALFTCAIPAYASDTMDAAGTLETVPVVETITLDENVVWSEDVPVDIGWKAAQDNGKWIEELGIGEDVTSLILVINNLDKEDTEAIPTLSEVSAQEKALKAGKKVPKNIADPDGKSRMTYLSQNADGEWNEVFSVNCVISGGEQLENAAIYGSYAPKMTLGVKGNPGSLLPFRKLTANDYWYLDPSDENYGEIYTAESMAERPNGAVKLEGLKCFFNYGMILQAESDEQEVSALMVNCRQVEYHDDTFCGIQMDERYLCMLLQTLTEDTRVIIAGSLDEIRSVEEGEVEIAESSEMSAEE